jgi:hypothetical protein
MEAAEQLLALLDEEDLRWRASVARMSFATTDTPLTERMLGSNRARL